MIYENYYLKTLNTVMLFLFERVLNLQNFMRHVLKKQNEENKT